jgi:anti-sigma-K factor RskA
MSLSLVIAINVLADTVLVGGLAYVMSRAESLTPHVASAEASGGEQQLAAVQRQARSRHSIRPQDARRTPIARRAGAQAATAQES